MSLSTTQYGYIVDPMVPFTDDKGKTIKNGFIRVFMAGTSTPVLTYRNYDGATNQEKIELDNSGRVKHNVIGSKGSLYKVVVYDAHHSQETPILTVDKIAVLGASITATGATIVTGLDSVTVQEENFLKATVEGTSVELSLDPTEVTSELSTIGAAATAGPDYVVPLLEKTGTEDSKKISLANLFKFALDWISRLATTITSFASGDFIAVSNPTDGARKMSKDTLLTLTSQNALAGNVAPEFVPTRDEDHKYLAGESVIYEGKKYIFKVDHYGEWSDDDVTDPPIGQVAKDCVDYTMVSLEGISTSGTPGSMVEETIEVERGTKVSVTIPSALWDVSTLDDSTYIFTFGYYDALGVAQNIAVYNKTNIGGHLNHTTYLPVGYEKYYVRMRGDEGAVADVFIAKILEIYDFVKNKSIKSVRTGSINVTGSGNEQKIVQIPLYGAAKARIDIPATYPVTGIDSYNNVCVIGYYTEITEKEKGSSIPRTSLASCTAANISTWAGTTQKVETPSTAKSLFLFVRCDSGETISFDYTIEQNVGIADNETDKNVRDLQIISKREDSLVKDFDPNRTSSNPYLVSEKVQKDGQAYIFVNQHYGAWNDSDVRALPIDIPTRGEQAVSSCIDYSLISSTGISTIGTPGNMVMREINVEAGTKVSVTIPLSLWSMSNLGSTSNVMSCGYKDSQGATHDVVLYKKSEVGSHLNDVVPLPVGYERYYVCMRGDAGAIADFVITEEFGISDFVKNEGRKSVMTGSVSITGAGDEDKVVQIPLYGAAKARIDIPSTYPVTGVTSSNNACQIGYYTRVTSMNGGYNLPSRPILDSCPARTIANWAGTTRAVNVPSYAKSLYLLVRCDSGETLTFNYTIEQNVGIADNETDKNVRDLQIAELEKKHDISRYNFVETRVANNPTVSSSDFPADMKRLSSTYIKARPIMASPGNVKTGSGFCVAPDGKVLVAGFDGANHIIGISSLYDRDFKNFNKIVASSGVGTVHSNFMWFGDEKYDSDDKYPLLYVGGVINEDDNTTSTMSVIRIVGDLNAEDSCSMVLVQTISFASTFGLVADIHKWGDKVVLWTGDKVWIFDGFPSLNDGNVTFTADDVETEYTLSGLVLPGAPQSGCIVGDKLYEIHGGSDNCYLNIINLTDGTAIQTLMPSYEEWETLSYYDKTFFASSLVRKREGGVSIDIDIVVCSLEFLL